MEVKSSQIKLLKLEIYRQKEITPSLEQYSSPHVTQITLLVCVLSRFVVLRRPLFTCVSILSSEGVHTSQVLMHMCVEDQ